MKRLKRDKLLTVRIAPAVLERLNELRGPKPKLGKGEADGRPSQADKIEELINRAYARKPSSK